MSTVHPIPPVYDARSKILILGSFPSVASREVGFFYGHKQNRFWKVLASLINAPLPETVAEKKALLTENGIALWDVIASCDIVGSADSSIKNAVANDISDILKCGVSAVFTNGKTASALYRKYIYPKVGVADVCLPSTSPANAVFSLQKLIGEWSVIKQYLSEEDI